MVYGLWFVRLAATEPRKPQTKDHEPFRNRTCFKEKAEAQ